MNTTFISFASSFFVRCLASSHSSRILERPAKRRTSCQINDVGSLLHMSQDKSNQGASSVDAHKSTELEELNARFSSLFDEHKSCQDKIDNYKVMLKAFHDMQDEVEKTLDAHSKDQENVKELLKTANIPEHEKKNKMDELSRFRADSKTWKSFFPSKSRGFLQAFIGTANVRMLRPAERQRYKFVCFFCIIYHLLEYGMFFYISSSLGIQYLSSELFLYLYSC